MLTTVFIVISAFCGTGMVSVANATNNGTYVDINVTLIVPQQRPIALMVPGFTMNDFFLQKATSAGLCITIGAEDGRWRIVRNIADRAVGSDSVEAAFISAGDMINRREPERNESDDECRKNQWVDAPDVVVWMIRERPAAGSDCFESAESRARGLFASVNTDIVPVFSTYDIFPPGEISDFAAYEKATLIRFYASSEPFYDFMTGPCRVTFKTAFFDTKIKPEIR